MPSEPCLKQVNATADWELAFAPGAELSNVTLEVRASGQKRHDHRRASPCR